MKRILVTGGNGYIASSLYRELRTIYDITTITRKDFDLTDYIKTKEWFSDKHFDMVIHTAIVGGSRLRTDDSSIIDANLKMYYNLLDNKDKFDRFISIGSGAELYQSDTPYGLSKSVIRKSMLEKDNFYNIRVFALFDENELPTRFIKSNIIRYINKETMVIHKNKKMDFFYMSDFVQLIRYYIDISDVPKEVDCTYQNSYTLSQIAEYINQLSDYDVNIEIKSGIDVAYTGNFFNTTINYTGLEKGIREVYNKLCK